MNRKNYTSASLQEDHKQIISRDHSRASSERIVLIKVNHVADGKGKSLIYRVFAEAEMILFCVYVV